MNSRLRENYRVKSVSIRILQGSIGNSWFMPDGPWPARRSVPGWHAPPNWILWHIFPDAAAP